MSNNMQLETNVYDLRSGSCYIRKTSYRKYWVVSSSSVSPQTLNDWLVIIPILFPCFPKSQCPVRTPMTLKMLFHFKDKRFEVLFIFVEGHISLSCLQTEVFSHLRLVSLILSSANLSLFKLISFAVTWNVPVIWDPA